MQRAKAAAGLDPQLRLYGLRHAFGTDAVRAHLNLKVIAEMMGHASVTQTEKYTHVAGDTETLRDALDVLARSRASKDTTR
jgi:site-specific recombinase XerD